MMSTLVRFAVIPGILLALVTLVRASLEQTDPDTAELLSVNWVFVAMLVLWPVLFLRAERRIGAYLITMLLLNVLVRVPIGTAYALAWDEKWTVEETGEPVRYRTDILTELEKQKQDPAEVTGTMNGVMYTLFTVVGGLIAFLITWTVVWLIGFRKSRRWTGAVIA